MKKSFSLIGIVLLLLVCGFFTLKLSQFPYFQLLPETTVDAFWEALMINDQYTLKGITVTDQWESVDLWVKNHPVTTCDWNKDVLGPTKVMSRVDNSTRRISLNIICMTESNNMYCLAVDKIIVQRVGVKWMVVDWANINEKCRF